MPADIRTRYGKRTMVPGWRSARSGWCQHRISLAVAATSVFLASDLDRDQMR